MYPIERWHCGNRQGRDEKEQGGPGHQLDEATEPTQITGAGRMIHRSRSQEEQSFVDRVIKHVVKCHNGRDRSEGSQMIGAKGQRHTQTSENDANVLDTRIRQHTLQIVLYDRIENPDQRGQSAQHKHK